MDERADTHGQGAMPRGAAQEVAPLDSSGPSPARDLANRSTRAFLVCE